MPNQFSLNNYTIKPHHAMCRVNRKVRMSKVIGLVGLLVLVAGFAFWAGRASRSKSDGPTQEDMAEVNILVAQCAHVPQDQIDDCTMGAYAKMQRH